MEHPGTPSVVGNCHVPPNGTAGYDYTNRRKVLALSDHWYRYPDVRGEPREINADDWGGTQFGYQKWILERVPKNPGWTELGYNNWWVYIANTDEELPDWQPPELDSLAPADDPRSRHWVGSLNEQRERALSNRIDTIARLEAARVSAILRTDNTERAREAMRAAVDGGFRVVEFTLTIPGAWELVEEFAADERLCVGVGTVLEPEQLEIARRAGARFVVSPVCDPAIIGAARELDLATIPGTFTATEMWTAHRAGADFVKLFPAAGDVVDYVTALRGPLPMLRIFPTSGVTLENFPAVLRAGAAGVGFVRPLFVPDDLANDRFDAIRNRAERIHTALREHFPAPAVDADTQRT